MGGVFKKLRDSMHVSPSSVYAELWGREELTVTGCSALIDFDNKTVCAATDIGRLVIRGDDLCICAFRHDLLIVSGRISSVGFEEEVCS